MSLFGRDVIFRERGRELAATVIEDRGDNIVDLMVTDGERRYCVRSVPFWMREELVQRRSETGEFVERREMVERSDGVPGWREP